MIRFIFILCVDLKSQVFLIHFALQDNSLIISTLGAIYIVRGRWIETTDPSKSITQAAPETSASKNPSNSDTNNKENSTPSSIPENSNSDQSENQRKFDQSYYYPTAVIVTKNSDLLHLQSSDEPGVITNWFKSVIEAKNMNIKNFVSTNTNGNIKNNLTGVGKEERVEIEIIKNSSDDLTEIKVNF